MDFEHADYVLGFALTFKYIYIFLMISSQYFFIGNQYMIHDGEKMD